MLTVIGHAKDVFEITQFNPPTPLTQPLVLNPFPFILCTVIFMLVNMQINNHDHKKMEIKENTGKSNSRQ